MTNACESYRNQMDLYLSGLLEDKQEIAWLLEHVQTCPACAARLSEFQRQEQDLDRWVDSLEPVVAEGQERTIGALRGMTARPPVTESNTLGKFLRSNWVHNAAAAVILIAAGFLAGRLSRPVVDTEQLAASLQPVLRERVLGAVLEQLRPEVSQEFRQLKEDVSAQMTEALQDYAGQTLALSNMQTNQRLEELIEAIQQAQIQDRRWVLSALDQIEQNRLQDQMKLREGLAVFAAATGDELARTHQKIDNLMLSGMEQ